jgi:hypothetical protein
MKKYTPYLIALVTFIVVALAYFYPVLEGKQILQSDIVQFKGSAKEIADYRVKTGKEPYWTNTSFGGMPAYMVSAYYPNDYIAKVDSVLRFLPRPADYLFLYLFGFFVLLSVFKVELKLAILGALAFGFSTYFIIILGVGHNAKAHAIAYFPLVLSGIILVFKKRYLIGFTLTAFAMALEIYTSHLQMTYYLMFLVIILGIVYLFDAIKNKTTLHFFKSIGILLVAVILGIGVNSTRLMASKQYKNVSTRGDSELTINPDGSKKENISGLDKAYITEYSYGFLETFNLFIPRFMGGGSVEKLDENSATYDFVKQAAGAEQARGFVAQLPTYWGKQPFVGAPAYIGAVVIFLFFLGAFLVDNKYKKWLVAATVFSLLLSYGKNLDFLTNFFIDYVPLYNIFRAVSSIQVIAELAIPLLGVLGLNAFFFNKTASDKKIKALKLATYVVGGFALFFTVFGRFVFSFEGQSDVQLDRMLVGLSDAIIEDRKTMFFKDSLRSLLLVIASAGILWAYFKEKIDYNKSVLILVGLILFDLISVDLNYVNSDKFVDELKVERPFFASKIDKEILKDNSHYRVANFVGNPMNESRTSYFHNSIGGYNAAKPRRYQELFDFQIASKMNEEVLNMLNTKYIIYPDEKGNETYQKNEEANGNAWFINEIIFANNADEEIKALTKLNTKNQAIVNKKYASFIKDNYPKDSTAIIKLVAKEINKFTYKSFSKKTQFAVFSEMFFDEWEATIDGEKVPIIQVDYVLRGLEIPKGEHEIVFQYQPKIVAKGNSITLISYLLLLIIPLGWFFYEKKKSKKTV